ncbi:unnamed protein product [Prunus armeniaca]
MEEFDFRWGGVAPKYNNLELHHGSVLESGEYKNGKVCYLDNVVEDFLSLVDLRKVGKWLDYNVDISNPKPNLEIWYRKGGTHGVGGLELINSDANWLTCWAKCHSQASIGCQGLDGANNYAYVQHNVQVEDETEVQDKSQVQYETGVQDKNKDEAEVVDSEEDDEEFVDSDYELSEEDFEFKTVEVPVHEGADDTKNDSNYGHVFEAPREVSSDGEQTSDFDTESEGDGDDKEGDNEGTSKINQDVQTFAIKKLSLEHTCGQVEKLKFANPKWICERFSSKIKINTYWNLKAFQGEVLEFCHVRVSKTQVYKAKRLAKAQIEENYIQQYARLWDYAEQLKNTNKGSTMKIKCDLVGDEAIFQRIYVCLAACKKGFLAGCRSVIGVYAFHLKGHYLGQILNVVGVDGNNGLFPIAYDVAEIENNDSWIWFMSLLIEDLGITNGLSWAFISDKQKRFIPAITHVLPTAEDRMCVWHLYNNFIATHLGLTLKHMLWAAARATTIPWYEAEMEKMKEEDLEAWEWLVHRPPNNWTRSHFHPRYKCDLLLNNLCESFNAAIIDAKDNSILTCLESIRMYVMLRMVNRMAACDKWKHHVGRRIFKIIEKNKMRASQCIPRLYGEKMYQVSHMYSGEFVVDLTATSCSCRRCDLCDIPCAHAISAIFHRDENPVEYVHECYKLETCIRSYEPIVHQIPSMDKWVKGGLPQIRLQFRKCQPGKPKRLRTKEAAEVQVPAPNPPNPLPPGYTALAAKLRKVFIKIRCGRMPQSKRKWKTDFLIIWVFL